MDEFWKDIPGFAGYQISNLGNARTCVVRYPGPAGRSVGSVWRELKTKEFNKYRHIVVTKPGSRQHVHFSVHRLVWELFVGPIPENVTIDHINNCQWDNRLSNLRLASHKENCRNSKAKRGRKLKGTYPYKIDGRLTSKFTAQIRCAGKSVHLGVFDSELEAAKAYNDAARKYFGEFANLNVIEDA